MSNSITTYNVTRSCDSDAVFYDREQAEIKSGEIKRTLYEAGYTSLADEYGKITKNVNRYANYIGFTDVTPYEIVRVISDKTIEVRQMDATLQNGNDLEFRVGGFAANCSNQDKQKYAYSSKPDYHVERLRRRKDGNWYNKHGARHALSTTPYKFYDYNF